MKTLAGWMMVATFAMMVAWGQTPSQGGGSAPAATTCPCGRVDCKCQGGGCGRMGSGQAQFRGRGQGRMAMRAGRMGAGNGACMRMRGQPAQSDVQPKVEKK